MRLSGRAATYPRDNCTIECSLKFPRWIRGVLAFATSLYGFQRIPVRLVSAHSTVRKKLRPSRISEYRGCRRKVAASPPGLSFFIRVYNSRLDFQSKRKFRHGERYDAFRRADRNSRYNEIGGPTFAICLKIRFPILMILLISRVKISGFVGAGDYWFIQFFGKRCKVRGLEEIHSNKE